MSLGPGISATPIHDADADRAWIDQLYRAHWAELCRYLIRAVGAGPPEPEDIAQSAFAKLASQKREAVGNPRAYLYAMARNAIADHHRKAQRHTAYGRDMMALQSDDPSLSLDAEQVLLSQEQLAIALAAIEQLPEAQRRAFLLNRVEGLSIKDIAEREGVSVDAAQRRVARAATKCIMAMRAQESSHDDAD